MSSMGSGCTNNGQSRTPHFRQHSQRIHACLHHPPHCKLDTNLAKFAVYTAGRQRLKLEAACVNMIAAGDATGGEAQGEAVAGRRAEGRAAEAAGSCSASATASRQIVGADAAARPDSQEAGR